ncbi:MAG: hypothetical protein WAK48_05335 [Candidatus Acidiferrum sp.]
MVRGVLFAITSALLLPISLPAQSETKASPPPVEVTIKPTGQHKQVVLPDTNSVVSVPQLSADIRNVSDKCVVAISLSILDKDSEGKIVATGNAALFRQQNGQFNCLNSGQTASHVLSGGAIGASGRPATPEVSVDFVIFGDGSTWGPGKDLEQKGYLRGKFDTYKHIQSQKNTQDCSS